MPVARNHEPRATKQRQRPRRWFSRLAWALVAAVMIVLLLPYVLVPLYRVINPVSTLMLWRLASGSRMERSFVPIERMAPALPVTVIASEAGRFSTHRGIDCREIRERRGTASELGPGRGAPTGTRPQPNNQSLW